MKNPLILSRLYFIISIVEDLKGSYNTFGIRRWFSRQRKFLKGLSPKELFVNGWNPKDEEIMKIKKLSRSLVE